MKRIMALMALMAMLIAVAYADTTPAKILMRDNDDLLERAQSNLTKMIEEYETAQEWKKALLIEMAHRYYGIYNATRMLIFPLDCYMSRGYGYSTDLSAGYVVIEEYELGKWKAYLNGEISGDEYIWFMKEMYETSVEASDRAKQDIDGLGK